MAKTSYLMVCSKCGWKNSRQASTKGVKLCAKCGGHMIFPRTLSGDADTSLSIWIIVGGILFMGVVGVVWEITKFGG